MHFIVTIIIYSSLLEQMKHTFSRKAMVILEENVS